MGRTVNQGGEPAVKHFRQSFADSAADLKAVQQLRYDVFVKEMGSDGPGVDHASGLEADRFDPLSHHLMLWDADVLVGTYRLLDAKGAAQAGGFYSADEFDLSALLSDGRPLLELGRSCIRAEYRKGTALLQLWQGLARYVMAHQISLLFGVASFPGTDVDRLAAPLSLLHHVYPADPALRPVVLPEGRANFQMLPPDRIDRKAVLQRIPPLIKSYLRIGGGIGDGAFVDHQFKTTDVAVVVDVDAMTPAQKRNYTKGLSS